MVISTQILFFLAIVAFVIWIFLLFAWGGFWQTSRFDADGESIEALADWPRIAVVVAARNEAASIGQSMASLCAQDYPGEFSIIVVDDHSEDATADITRAAARDSIDLIRVDVISAPPLQPGWTGKLAALNTGVELAAKRDPDFFWFTDADIVHTPGRLRGLVSRAQSHNLDLASLMVLLRTEKFVERLLLPPFLYFFLMLYPPRWIAEAGKLTAGAAGGCILIRRTALERIGGLGRIRGEVIDDCALARAVKRSGGRIWMGLTRASRSLRGYGSIPEIRDLIARTAFAQLNYSLLSLLGTLAGMAFVFILPVILTFSLSARIWPFALLAWCLMSVSFAPTLIFCRISPLLAPFLPFAALFYSYSTLISAIRYWLGRGGQWKGRAQAKGSKP